MLFFVPPQGFIGGEVGDPGDDGETGPQGEQVTIYGIAKHWG